MTPVKGWVDEALGTTGKAKQRSTGRKTPTPRDQISNLARQTHMTVELSILKDIMIIRVQI